MSGWPLKDKARVAGVDDGIHVRGSERTPVFITIMRLDGYIDGIVLTSVETDGTDSSRTLSDALHQSGHLEQVRAIISDGACLAGFNVLDLRDLRSRTGVPVITCSDKAPTSSIMEALTGNFPDANERIEKIARYTPRRVDLPDGPCYIRCEGITEKRAEWIVRRTTVRGRTPEPVRVSHLIARSLGALKEPMQDE